VQPTTQTQIPILKDGVRLDGLEIQRVLHSDGRVVSARGKVLGKPGRLLLQLLHPQAKRDRELAYELEVEGAAHAMLEEPCFAPFADMGKADGLVWYGRRWTEGPSLEGLQAQLHGKDYRPYGHLALLFAGVARALQEAHSSMVRGEPHALSFGPIRKEHLRFDRQARLTLGGWQPDGKARMLCRRGGYRPQTDLRWLAEHLFETAVGVTPAAAKTESGLGQIPPASSIVLGFPEALEEILQRALAPDEDAWFADGVDLAEALEGFAEGERWHADAAKVADWVSGLFPSWRLDFTPTDWSNNDFGNGPSTDEVTAWFTPPKFDQLLTEETPAPLPEPMPPKPRSKPRRPVPTPLGIQHHADLGRPAPPPPPKPPPEEQPVVAHGSFTTTYDEESDEDSVSGTLHVVQTRPPKAVAPTAVVTPTGEAPVAEEPKRRPNPLLTVPDPTELPLPAEPAAGVDPDDPRQLATALATVVAHRFSDLAEDAIDGDRSSRVALGGLVALFVAVVVGLFSMGGDPPRGYAGDKVLVAGFILGNAETLLEQGEHLQVELALREVRRLGQLPTPLRARTERVGVDLDISRSVEDLQRAFKVGHLLQVVDECERILRQRPGHEGVLALLAKVAEKRGARGSAGVAADRARYLIEHGGG
jgi:hypothetical protein